MSRKVSPTALRTGISKDWNSQWYAEGDKYAESLIEDIKIRRYLHKTLRNAGLSSVIIERSTKDIKLIIKVSKPGVVIGRKGVGLSMIREGLKKISSGDIELQIEEVSKPDLDASIVGESIAVQIERRIHARRAMNIAAEKAIDAGAKGVKVQVGGTIHGPNSIAITYVVLKKAVPTQTIRADIDYAVTTAYTRGGTIGIKVWIYKGEIK